MAADQVGGPAGAAAEDGSGLEALLARGAAGSGTRSPAVAATWHLEKHARYVAARRWAASCGWERWRLWATYWVHDDENGWVDGLAVPAEGWSSGGGTALATALARHLAWLIEALSRHCSERALWCCVGDRVG